MKRIVPVIFLLLCSACVNQPNRPLTSIDIIENANKKTVSPSPVASSSVQPIMTATPTPEVTPENTQAVKILFKGIIYNRQDKTPLEGAVVKLGEFTDTTDSEGNYSIPDVPTGIYVYTVSKKGFRTFLDDAMNIKANYGRTETFISPLLQP